MDAVITWVDGGDPVHHKNRHEHMNPDLPHADIDTPTRYHESGEIYFCLASIIKFAPFIERIFIVTDAQTPQRLPTFIEQWNLPDGFIRVIDHTETFKGFEKFLPTFNAHSIEAMLHRIPDLAEEFIYLNDDFLLIRPLQPEQFFDEKGPVLRGSIRKYSKDRLTKVLRTKVQKAFGVYKNRSSFGMGLQISGLLVGGLPKFLQIGHGPHPIRRSTLERFFEGRPEVLTKQLQHKFREHTQFSMMGLTNHLEMRNGNMPNKPEHALYIKASRINAAGVAKLFQAADEQNAKWACIQSLEGADPEIRDDILRRLREIIPDFPST